MICRAQFVMGKFPLICKVKGKHWYEKICPPCRDSGFTKTDDPRLSKKPLTNDKEDS